jgi:hypothetical protein
LIERAYRQGEAMGLAVWTQDEAGPYQTLPYPGHSWQAPGSAQRQPHEYPRNGTAKLLTYFIRPAVNYGPTGSGNVPMKCSIRGSNKN